VAVLERGSLQVNDRWEGPRREGSGEVERVVLVIGRIGRSDGPVGRACVGFDVDE